MSIFSERLKAKGKKKGMAQIEIAERLGIAQFTYAHCERESREPDLEMLRTTANILQTTVDCLVEWTKE